MFWLAISLFLTVWKNFSFSRTPWAWHIKGPIPQSPVNSWFKLIFSAHPGPDIYVLCSPFQHCIRNGLYVTTQYGRSDAMSFLGLDHKRHFGFCLSISFSLWSFSLGDTSCCVLKTLRQSYESSCGKILRPPANSHMNEPSWKQTSSPASAFKRL